MFSFRSSAAAAGILTVTLSGTSFAAEPPSAADPPPAARVERLSWLAGCWARETAGRIVEEQWMVPRGGSMLGMSRTVSEAEGRTVEFEAVRIEERAGLLTFTAKPSGQPEASFTCIDLTDSLVIFENKGHDFPQRVGYRVRPDGGLAAWIEGRPPRAAPDAPVRRVDFPYDRTRCPGK